MRTLTFHIDVPDEFRRAARYTCAMLSLILGHRPRFFIGEADDIVDICYASSPCPCRVWIPFNESTLEFFKKRVPMDASSVQNWTDPKSTLTLLRLFPRSRVDQDVATEFDLVGASFYFLSLFEEIVVTERDEFDRFPCGSGLLGSREEWDRPVVAEYAFYLKHRLEMTGRNIPLEDRVGGKPFAVVLTHDVDYLRKWRTGIAYRELVRLFLMNDSDQGFGRRLSRLNDFLKTANPSHDPYRVSLRKLLEIEKRYGVTATYFLKTGKSNKRDLYYRPSDAFLAKWRAQALEAGMELGFHPSFETYRDKELWEREQRIFLQEYGLTPEATRQHYLRYAHPATLHILEQTGVKYDSTLGLAAREGYRNGMVHPFLLFDLDADRVSHVWEVPLHVMDGTLVSYRKYDPDASLQRIRHFIGQASRWHGILTLLFHNVCADEWDYPGWMEIVEKSIQTALERGAFVGSIRDVLQAWLPESYHDPGAFLIEEIG